MKKLLAGGATLAVATAVGAAGLATPGGAQRSDLTQLEATASPEVANPGSTVAITSGEDCAIQDGYVHAGMWMEIRLTGTPDADTPELSSFVPSETFVRDLTADGRSLEELGFPETTGMTANPDLDPDAAEPVPEGAAFISEITAPTAPGDYIFTAECWQFPEDLLDVSPDGDEAPEAERDEPGAETGQGHGDEAGEAPPTTPSPLPGETAGELADVIRIDEAYVASFTVAGAPAVDGTPALTG